MVGSQVQATKILEITVGGRSVKVPSGTPASHLLSARRDSDGNPYLAAIFNNHLVDIDSRLFSSGELRPVTVASKEGAAVYRRSLTLVLYEAASLLFPKMQLVIGQSLGYGYHFTCREEGKEGIDNGRLLKLEEKMVQLIKSDLPIKHEMMTVEEAIGFFQERGALDKVQLLATWRQEYVTLISLGAYYDIQHGPVAPTTGGLLDFGLNQYPPGFVLQFPSMFNNGDHPANYDNQKPLFRTYQETMHWNEIMGVRTVGQLNELCLSGEISEIIRVSEGFHEKKIAQLADMIAERRHEVRVVLISGPSSSGKTTFAKRLGLQLRVNGIRPVALSMDNYYVDRELTPRHPDGSYDFEALEAIDLNLFNEQLLALLSGQEVKTPIYNFNTGMRETPEKWVPMSIGQDDIIIVEGIHGLNPRFTASLRPEQKFRIYINALTQLCIDSSNRIFTSETRLIRRIVRDRRYRGYGASRTIELWPSVRLGERRHIFPFQQEADAIFNSALVYEPAVLKTYAERYLLQVPRNDPRAVTANQLLHFLDLFVPIGPEDIPPTSLLREFIGGSAFHY